MGALSVTVKYKKMVVQKTLQSLATFFSLCCASFASSQVALLWGDNSYYTFVDFCPWLAWICALLAFSGHGDAKAGSAGGVAVQGNLGDALSVLAKCNNAPLGNCHTSYVAMIMQLCAIVTGSIGCFIAVAALAATFSVAKTVVGIA